MSNIDFPSNLQSACQLLRDALESGAGLLILSGAGLSVQSGVPVFRMADGTMSPDFLKFLGDYNAARKKNGMPEAPDWFSFSVPEMFRAETAKEAWQYWRWRMLRALVEPADDYQQLNKIIDSFGTERVFALTSNCDMLHVTAGLPKENIFEIHGSLGYLQCSRPCGQTLYPVDEPFLSRLREEPDWVPICLECQIDVLRPNVMIFDDYALVEQRLVEQERRFEQFKSRFLNSNNHPPSKPAVVLEIGAGRVVSSIRCYGESLGLKGGGGLIRINPCTNECAHMELSNHDIEFSDIDAVTDTGIDVDGKRRTRPRLLNYYPLDRKANEALKAICTELDL